jgi:hypothetical protein
VDVLDLLTSVARQSWEIEKHEQRFVIKFFWMRGFAASAIDPELQHTLDSRTYSEDWVESSVRRFASGDQSRADLRPAGRPRTDLSEPLRKFPHNFPFATARMMSRQFSAQLTTMKEIFSRDSGLKKFATR